MCRPVLIVVCACFGVYVQLNDEQTRSWTFCSDVVRGCFFVHILETGVLSRVCHLLRGRFLVHVLEGSLRSVG